MIKARGLWDKAIAPDYLDQGGLEMWTRQFIGKDEAKAWHMAVFLVGRGFACTVKPQYSKGRFDSHGMGNELQVNATPKQVDCLDRCVALYDKGHIDLDCQVDAILRYATKT